jgi:hypothetical protein
MNARASENYLAISSKSVEIFPAEIYWGRLFLGGWLESWLTTREQKVLVDGEKSRSVKVKSGVPQGTVLGPLMFLLYINDIGENIRSSERLFADDSLVYMAVSSRNDCQRLQDDLTTMVNWSKKWQMIFNPSKCYTLRHGTDVKEIGL